MIRGLYIAATNMVMNTKEMDTISNNLANVNTTGFKKDNTYQTSFNSVLLSKVNGSSSRSEPAFNGMTVEDNNGAHKVSTDFGYFRVMTEDGLSFHKDMKFTVNSEGNLSTYYLNSDKTIDENKGDLVYGNKGPIHVGEGQLEVKENGDVVVDGNIVDNLIYNTGKDEIGTINSGVKFDRLMTDFTQGQLNVTDRSLDVALNGDGFYTLATEYGTMYTRNGSFNLNGDGNLVSNMGYPVEGFNGPITLENDDFGINEFGEIIVDGEIVDKLKITTFSNKGDLEKVGGSMFVYSDKPTGEIIPFEGTVVQGSIETSNADSIGEMIKMMNMSRNYESGQKVISTIDEAIKKVVNEVGRI